MVAYHIKLRLPGGPGAGMTPFGFREIDLCLGKLWRRKRIGAAGVHGILEVMPLIEVGKESGMGRMPSEPPLRQSA